jgi:hypothetical protein
VELFMLKAITGAIASLVLISTPVFAQRTYYENLTSRCNGVLYAYNQICSEYTSDGQEIRYLIAPTDNYGEIKISVGFPAGFPLLSIKIPDQELHFAMLNGDGDLFYESFPGAYQIMEQYFSEAFLYLFNSYE